MTPPLIDISLPISERSVTWPTAPRPELRRRLSIERGDHVDDSDLFMNVHTGTHIDAPRHFIRGAAGAHEAPLEALIGEAWVIEARTPKDLTAQALRERWPTAVVERVLIKTDNSRLWQRQPQAFTREFAALLPDAAQWLVTQRVRLVGIDYLSIQRFGDPPTVHELLLGAGIVIVEGLDLSAVEPGCYELLCLPLKLVDCDGAPARAVLRRRA